MYFVGFPDGLGVTIKSLKEQWLPGINKNNKRRHYSIYHTELGYCGESYYKVEDNSKAALDIKLLPIARGKGVAYEALRHAITNAFNQGSANVVYVDPHKDNVKALNLYKKLNFKLHKHPNQELSDKHYYLELAKEDYK